jgi:CHAT domain
LIVRQNMYPTLHITVLARPATAGSHPLLSFQVLRYLHSAPDSMDGIAPTDPLSVTQTDKNKFVNVAMETIAGSLVHDPLGDPAYVSSRLRNIGKWISDRLLPTNCFACCGTAEHRLPKTISFLSDQYDIPWEITAIGSKFLSEVAIHARRPFVASGRDKPIKYGPTTNMLVIVGKSKNLTNARLELREISKLMSECCDTSPDILEGEEVTSYSIRDLLESGKQGRPYDIIHFIGHGSVADEKIWLELPAGPLLLDDIPSIILGNPLVFLNSCSSAVAASSKSYKPEVSVGFGTRFLAGGASHFLGPLLPVPDETARSFACRFYKYIFGCSTVGDALYRAKKEFDDQNGVVHTYVLYGDPSIRVKTPIRDGRAKVKRSLSNSRAGRSPRQNDRSDRRASGRSSRYG